MAKFLIDLTTSITGSAVLASAFARTSCNRIGKYPLPLSMLIPRNAPNYSGTGIKSSAVTPKAIPPIAVGYPLFSERII